MKYEISTGRQEVTIYAGSGGGGVPAAPLGNASLGTGQVSVDSTSGGTLVAAPQAGRGSLTVVNGGTVELFLGNAGVTVSTGVSLPGIVGANMTLPFVGAVYGITNGGTADVSYVETFG